VGDGDKRHVAIIAMMTRSSAPLCLASFWLIDWNPKSCFHCRNNRDDQLLRDLVIGRLRCALAEDNSVRKEKDPMKELLEIFHASRSASANAMSVSLPSAAINIS